MRVKNWALTLLLSLSSIPAFSQGLQNTGYGLGTISVSKVQTSDGATSCYPSTLEVSPATLTCNPNGTAVVSTGSTSPASPPGSIQYNNAGAFGSIINSKFAPLTGITLLDNEVGWGIGDVPSGSASFTTGVFTGGANQFSFQVYAARTIGATTEFSNTPLTIPIQDYIQPDDVNNNGSYLDYGPDGVYNNGIYALYPTAYADDTYNNGSYSSYGSGYYPNTGESNNYAVYGVLYVGGQYVYSQYPATVTLSSNYSSGSYTDYPYSSNFNTTYAGVQPYSVSCSEWNYSDAASYSCYDNGGGAIIGYYGLIAYINYSTGAVSDATGGGDYIETFSYNYATSSGPYNNVIQVSDAGNHQGITEYEFVNTTTNQSTVTTNAYATDDGSWSYGYTSTPTTGYTGYYAGYTFNNYSVYAILAGVWSQVPATANVTDTYGNNFNVNITWSDNGTYDTPDSYIVINDTTGLSTLVSYTGAGSYTVVDDGTTLLTSTPSSNIFVGANTATGITWNYGFYGELSTYPIFSVNEGSWIHTDDYSGYTYNVYVNYIDAGNFNGLDAYEVVDNNASASCFTTATGLENPVCTSTTVTTPNTFTTNTSYDISLTWPAVSNATFYRIILTDPVNGYTANKHIDVSTNSETYDGTTGVVSGNSVVPNSTNYTSQRVALALNGNETINGFVFGTYGTSVTIGNGAGSGLDSNSAGNFLAGTDAGQNATSMANDFIAGLYAGAGSNQLSSSIALGQSACQNLNNGVGVMCLGLAAGSNTSGVSFSNFVGENSANGASSASYTNAFGAFSADNATNVSHSNLFGFDSGASANIGYGNCFGDYSCTAATGNNITGIGNYSLEFATHADNVFAAGAYAGYHDTVNNSTGGWNLLFGPYTNTGGYSNSITLGGYTKNSATGEINLGNAVQIEGIYTGTSQSSTLTTGATMNVGGNATFSGQVGIGVTEGSYALNIYDINNTGYDIGDYTTGDWKISNTGVATFQSLTLTYSGGGEITFQDGTTQSTASTSQWTGTSPIYYDTGVVGIGTSSPTYNLDLYDSQSTGYDIGDSTTGLWKIANTGVATFGTAPIFGDSNYNVIIGLGSASGINSTIIGNSASSSAQFSEAIGAYASVSGDYSIAIGYYSNAVGTLSSCIGHGANSIGNYSASMGSNAYSAADFSSSIGSYSRTDGQYSIAIGYASYAANTNEINFSSNDSTYGTLNSQSGYTQLDIYNGIANFQGNYIDALKFVTTGGTSSQCVKGDGSLGSCGSTYTADVPLYVAGTHVGINWDSSMLLDANKLGVNWSEMPLINHTGINWQDFKYGQLNGSGINWASINNINYANVNWTDINQHNGFFNSTGINWNNFVSHSGINWADFTQANLTGVNWAQFLTGINWNQIGGIQGTINVAGFNWANLSQIANSTSGINWAGITSTYGNWVDISGINPLYFGNDQLAYLQASATTSADLKVMTNTATYTFPQNGVLDTFTRANAGTLGSNWTNSTNAAEWGNDTLGITSNSAYDPSGSDGATAWWNASSFSGTLEAYVKFSSAATNHGQGISFVTTPTSYNGYRIYWIQSQSKVYIVRLTASTSSAIASTTLTMSSGDSLGATITPAGLITVYYKSGSGSWSSVLTGTDSTYSCSYIGIAIDDTSTRAVNFGGGSVTTTASETSRFTTGGNALVGVTTTALTGSGNIEASGTIKADTAIKTVTTTTTHATVGTSGTGYAACIGSANCLGYCNGTVNAVTGACGTCTCL